MRGNLVSSWVTRDRRERERGLDAFIPAAGLENIPTLLYALAWLFLLAQLSAGWESTQLPTLLSTTADL